MRALLVIAGVLSTLFVAHWGIWFGFNAEPDEFGWVGVLLFLALGSIFGAGFWLTALLAGRPSFLGRASRVFGLLMLIFPTLLFGTIAKEQIARLFAGGNFMIWPFLTGCAGLAAVVLALIVIVRAEFNDRGNDGSNHALNTDAERPQRAG
jgi:hypothetical protein